MQIHSGRIREYHQPKKPVVSNSLLLLILVIEALFIGVLYLAFSKETLTGNLIQTLKSGVFFQPAQQTPPASISADPLPVLLGVYPSDALQVTYWELENMDLWLNEEGVQARISLAGTYMDIEFHNPEYNVPAELNAAWNAGYTPFVNLTAYQHTAAEVAGDPAVEKSIRAWAAAYAEWSAQGQRRAFIAPLQEMNGGWVRYGMDPENFKKSFLKIQQIFREEGVAEDAVSWVFSPNGWSEEGHEFERYYPGDAYVDIVGFSTVNFGTCPDYIGNWDTYDLVIRPYLERMQKMAPGKPIFLTQLATVNVGENGPDDDLKDEWLMDTYTQLAAFPGVRAVLYFNRLKSEGSITNCRPVDWRIFDAYAEVAFDGFLEAVRSPRFQYWSPDSAGMTEVAFAAETPGSFLDAWPAEPFSGKEDPVYLEWIEILADLRIAPGCSAEEYSILGTTITNHYFCPQAVVTRADFAHFLVLALHGPQVNLPAAANRFTDLPPDHWVSPWVEQLAQDGLQLECSPGLFCPDLPVTRAEMAALLADAFFLPESNNPGPASGLFYDLPANHPLASRVEQMVQLAKTGGCSETEYCPDKEITRAELAFALVSTFELYQPERLSWYQAELRLVHE
ncbi:MAG: hypothetical protein JXA25_16295 [Anaerolineales bacterium]|nr:hypothetical protein [Anaerolineales bacterium]